LKGWNVIQSPQILEWQAQARDEGRKEGAREARKEMLIDVLEGKFAPLPSSIVEAIRKTTDDALLKRWAVFAGRATSLDQFKQDAGLT
jgi:hypothetical protein